MKKYIFCILLIECCYIKVKERKKERIKFMLNLIKDEYNSNSIVLDFVSSNLYSI